MNLRIKGTWILAGLAALVAMSAGGHVAQAGSVSVKGHITPLPGGSPFVYEFDLYLLSGSIAPGATFTVGTGPNALVGVTGQSGYQVPPSTDNLTNNQIWYVPSGGIVTTPTGDPRGSPYDKQSSVTFNYFSGPTIDYGSATAPILIAVFDVETAASFPDDAPPAIAGVTSISYTYSLPNTGTGPSTGGGSTILTAGGVVPEPSSAILLLVGACGVPLFGLVRRSRAKRLD